MPFAGSCPSGCQATRLIFGAVDAEDLDAGFDAVLTRDGDEDVLAVGRPDGLRGMAAGVEGVDVENLCGRDRGCGECGCEEQRTHEATISFGERSVSKGVANFPVEDVRRMLAPMATETMNATAEQSIELIQYARDIFPHLTGWWMFRGW